MGASRQVRDVLSVERRRVGVRVVREFLRRQLPASPAGAQPRPALRPRYSLPPIHTGSASLHHCLRITWRAYCCRGSQSRQCRAALRGPAERPPPADDPRDRQLCEPHTPMPAARHGGGGHRVRRRRAAPDGHPRLLLARPVGAPPRAAPGWRAVSRVSPRSEATAKRGPGVAQCRERWGRATWPQRAWREAVDWELGAHCGDATNLPPMVAGHCHSRIEPPD